MPGQSEMPEREFDESEAFYRMNEAVGETIAGLPDFPGFQARRAIELDCPDPDYVSYELSYKFPENTIGDDLVTAEYFEVLKQHWPAIGFEIHAERNDADGNVADLEARRPDGVNIWYDNLLGQIIIHAQAGCVKRTDETPACPPALGGVTEENDLVHSRCHVVDDAEDSPGEPSATESDEAAVDPFDTEAPNPYSL